jgi:enoyl-CoA hydratase/carnithine racemase
VAVVQGDCLGAGCSLAAASDIVVAQPDARFSLPEIKLGLAPVLAMAAVAPVMSPRLLYYWSASGRHFTAAEARDAGLVTQVVAAGEIDAFVADLTGELARAESAALAHVKGAARTLGERLDAPTRHLLMKDMIATATHPAARSAIDRFLQRKKLR